MRQHWLLLLLALSTTTTQAKPPLHLDPDMTGKEYRNLFNAMEKDKNFQLRIAANPLVEILTLGKRNLDWIEAINSKRDDAHKLQLTTPETTPAYPIDAPGNSNPTLIMARLNALKQTMPADMSNIIFGTGAIPDSTTVDDKTFISNAFTLNRIYEAASRWLLEEPYLEEYKNNAQGDIRGYYFLSKEKELDQNLNHWSSLDLPTQTKYTNWLVGECNNTMNNIDNCQKELTDAIKKKQVLAYHQKYVTTAAETYNELFEIVNPRPEALWNDRHPDTLYMPFATPKNQDVQDWFKTNVEDEFHVNDWHLSIMYNYGNPDNLAKVVFEPGATPHVNYLGGNTITMDANRALQEYEVTWTIRHEFGHILGFPDCYVEFYDEKNAVMVNYQVDITNLMCSRRGHLQAKHVEQLKKHYYHH